MSLLSVNNSFWATNPAKANIRKRLTARFGRTPRKHVLALPAGKALDIFSALNSGLFDTDTQYVFAEQDDTVAEELRRTMSIEEPEAKYKLYSYSITEHRKWFVKCLSTQPCWGKIDYCYLDYCGAMTPWRFELHQLLTPGLQDGAVLNCTLTYAHGTGTKNFKRMVAEHVTEEDVDQLKYEINQLPPNNRVRFNNKEYWNHTALVSYILWRKSWGNAPVLKQFYAYVGGARRNGRGAGAAMISFRTWFKKPQITP